jgi:hypothetical protein
MSPTSVDRELAMKKRVGIVLVLVVGALSITMPTSYRVLSKDTGAQLLWTADEAYLFLGTNELGWGFSPARIALERILYLFQTTTTAQRSRSSVTVFRITAKSVDRHDANNMMLGPYGVVDDHIVSGLWRWTGERFEPATADERAKWLEKAPPQFSDVAGWSKRSLNPGSFPIDLGGKRVVLTVSRMDNDFTAIELQRNGLPSEKIWSVAHSPRKVTKAEYEAMFETVGAVTR